MDRTRGFSLIELLIIVAIIGIIASIATPRLIRYRVRARRAEMFTNLAAIGRLQQAHLGTHNTYTDNLTRLQWSPTGNPRYLYGFTSDAAPAASGVNDTAELRATGGGHFASDLMIDAFGNPLSQNDLPTAAASKTRFRAAASANLDRDVTLDQWILDSDDNQIVLVKDDFEE